MSKRMVWLLIGILAVGAVATGSAQAGFKERLAEILRDKVENQDSREAPFSSDDGLQQLVERNASAFNSTLKSAAGSSSLRDGATKVVPILTVGQGKAVGIAQVAGPAAAVHGVQAVVAVEVALLGKRLQGRVLIPVDTRDISKGYHRIGQVGVSAMLDYQL